jgi:hypothetical protein
LPTAGPTRFEDSEGVSSTTPQNIGTDLPTKFMLYDFLEQNSRQNDSLVELSVDSVGCELVVKASGLQAIKITE